MSEKSYHTVELNLPCGSIDDLPIPDKAPVVINGVPLKWVKSVKVDCDSDNQGTLVTVEFWAAVTGLVRTVRVWPGDSLEDQGQIG